LCFAKYKTIRNMASFDITRLSCFKNFDSNFNWKSNYDYRTQGLIVAYAFFAHFSPYVTNKVDSFWFMSLKFSHCLYVWELVFQLRFTKMTSHSFWSIWSLSLFEFIYYDDRLQYIYAFNQNDLSNYLTFSLLNKLSEKFQRERIWLTKMTFRHVPPISIVKHFFFKFSILFVNNF